MKCCANIYFNRQCINKKVVPKYANIRIPHTSPAANVSLNKIHKIRIKDELKFLYKKKEKLNTDLCKIHLQATQEWGKTWYFIIGSLNESINQELNKKYKTLDDKLMNMFSVRHKNAPTNLLFILESSTKLM